MECIWVKDLSETKETCRDSQFKELIATIGVINLWLNGQYSQILVYNHLSNICPSCTFCAFFFFLFFHLGFLSILVAPGLKFLPHMRHSRCLLRGHLSSFLLSCSVTLLERTLHVCDCVARVTVFPHGEWQAQRPMRIEEQKIQGNKKFWKITKFKRHQTRVKKLQNRIGRQSQLYFPVIFRLRL